jgi:putative ABC transport system permease protein
MIFSLARRNLLARKARTLLTVAAIALSVALVVSVTSGYASIKAAVYGYIAKFEGSFDAQISHPGERGLGVPRSLLADVARDDAVRRVIPRIETDQVLIGPSGVPPDPRPVFITALDPTVDDAPRQLSVVEGRWFASADAKEIVIDQGVRDRAAVKLGDTLTIPAQSGSVALTVVGVIHKPGPLTAFFQTAYVPLDTVQPLVYPADPSLVTQLRVQFEPKTDASAFVARWEERLAPIAPRAKVTLLREKREQLDRQLIGVDVMSYMGGAASMLAATFIVFSTLAMGVTERQRTLAMLRAIGAARSQVAGLVVAEGVLLATIGVVVGVPLGIAFLASLRAIFPGFFTEGLVVSLGGVAFASVVSVLAALAASLLPAFAATRVDPLEAMNPLSRPASSRPPLGWAILGLALASIDALLVFAPLDRWFAAVGLDTLATHHRELRFYAHFAIGIPGVLLGMFLMAPLLVWILDRLATPLISRLVGIRPALFRQQFGGALWRGAGTGAALMVGLAILIVLQTQGRSALGAWKLPTQFPDVFVFSPMGGVDESSLQRIRSLEGVNPDRVMPIGVFAPQFAGTVFGLAGMAMMPDATTFIAVDPARLFDMMELDFRDGDPASAQKLLSSGQHLLVTEELARVQKIRVGDRFPLKKPDGSTVEYTVAGVVWSPGMDVMIAAFDMRRQFDRRTAATVFGSLEDARRDFDKKTFELVAADVNEGVIKRDLVYNVKQQLGQIGLVIADVRQLKLDITRNVEGLLFLGSTVAWCAMLVASLGVTNTIIAGIRTRRWQFGILRSIGATRGTLLRMVLAESVMLGLVGLLLGLGAGLLMSLNAWKFYDVLVGFRPPLTIPWGSIAIGGAVVMIGSVAAAILPAIGAARTEVLALLQGGRAAT